MSAQLLQNVVAVAAILGWTACVLPSEQHAEIESSSSPEIEATAIAQSSSLVRASETAQRRGDLAQARALAERAVTAAEAADEPRELAAALAVHGHTLLALDRLDGARVAIQRAIGIAAAIGAPRVEAMAHLNLGHLLRRTDAPEAAVRSYAAAAEAAERAGDARQRALAEVSGLRARVVGPEAEAGSVVDAAESALEAVQRVETPAARAEFALHAARSLLIGAEAASLGAAPSPSHLDVTRRLLDLGDRAVATPTPTPSALQAELLGERGRLAWLAGEPALALEWTGRALLASESSGSEANRIRWHRQAAALEQASGRPDAALRNAREAVRLIEEHRHALAQLPDEFGDRDRARKQIRSVYVGYVDLLLERAQKTTEPARRRADLARARDTLELYKAAELRDHFEDECVDRYRGRIRAIDDIAGANVTVLYPVVLPDRIALLVSGVDGLVLRSVPVAEAELRQTARRFRQLLVKRATHQYLGPARRLYDWLVRPIEDLLPKGQSPTLVFVPDGVLRTVPLSALHDGEGFLIERFAIATTPGIELTDPRPIEQGSLDVLLGGLTQATEGFAALPHVERELSGIRAEIGGELLLDERFESAAVAEMIAGRDFDLVHLATHASFDEESSSGFIVTHDGRLGLDALAEALTGSHYREKPLELLVMSACETARGSEQAALGLSGIAIRAGARSAIGSLWKVNDEAAASLMVGFYEALRSEGTTRAEALRRSQLALIEQRTFRHPAFWSAFLLLNSWL